MAETKTFIVVAADGQDAGDKRTRLREAHVAHLKGGAEGLKLLCAGPIDATDKGGTGTFLLVEAAEKAAVRAFVESDPFAREGIFESIDIHETRVTLGSAGA